MSVSAAPDAGEDIFRSLETGIGVYESGGDLSRWLETEVNDDSSGDLSGSPETGITFN